jgi:hypothetical protein
VDRINPVIVHDPWGFDKLFPYLKDAFRVLNEAYKRIYTERLRNPYTKRTDKKKWDLENILTEDLVRIAEGIPTQLSYEWDHESKNLSKKNRIDITIIYALGLGFEQRLGIECKRLKNNNRLCKEYYENGIRRFATGYYSERMPIAGMIGFIQEGNAPQIVLNINQRLDQLDTIQLLQAISLVEQVRFTYLSQHKRRGNLGEIKLYHLMLDYIKLII